MYNEFKGILFFKIPQEQIPLYRLYKKSTLQE